MTQGTSRSIVPRIKAFIQIPRESEPTLSQNQKALPSESYHIEDNQKKAVLLTPGVEKEVWLQIENSSTQDLCWSVEIAGDFPQNWSLGFLYSQQTSQTIAPGEKAYTSLCLLLPKDFFEQQEALNKQNRQLQLNYQCEICIYGECAAERELIAYQHFYIFARPDVSYINLLPEIYRRRDFLNRLLMIFEQGYDPSVQTLANLWAYLDPLTSPKALLPFLAKWVAWDMNPRWDLKQQRRLIKNAVELYRWRGSRRGVRLYIHLFTGLPLDEDLPESEKSICIEESFSTSFNLGSACLSENPKLGGGKPFYFSVTLRPENIEQIDEELVREVIEEAKPAFCTYKLLIIPKNSTP